MKFAQGCATACCRSTRTRPRSARRCNGVGKRRCFGVGMAHETCARLTCEQVDYRELVAGPGVGIQECDVGSLCFADSPVARDRRPGVLGQTEVLQPDARGGKLLPPSMDGCGSVVLAVVVNHQHLEWSECLRDDRCQARFDGLFRVVGQESPPSRFAHRRRPRATIHAMVTISKMKTK